MLVELAELLEPEIRQPRPVNQVETVEDRGELHSVPNDESLPRPRMTILSQDDLDWIHSLQNRIMDLEGELRRRQGKDVGIQTSFEQFHAPEKSQYQQYSYTNPFPS